MLYFINEECEVYDWPGTVEEQREEFPMDDHTPYETFDAAETAAEAMYHGGWVADEPVTIEERRAMGDDMLYPTHDLFGRWEN